MLILVVGELVERMLTKMMKGRKGSLIFDGMTRSGVHFIGTYAAFIADEGTPQEHLEVPLLSCSPMLALPEDEVEQQEGGRSLNASMLS